MEVFPLSENTETEFVLFGQHSKLRLLVALAEGLLFFPPEDESHGFKDLKNLKQYENAITAAMALLHQYGTARGLVALCKTDKGPGEDVALQAIDYLIKIKHLSCNACSGLGEKLRCLESWSLSELFFMETELIFCLGVFRQVVRYYKKFYVEETGKRRLLPDQAPPDYSLKRITRRLFDHPENGSYAWFAACACAADSMIAKGPPPDALRKRICLVLPAAQNHGFLYALLSLSGSKNESDNILARAVEALLASFSALPVSFQGPLHNMLKQYLAVSTPAAESIDHILAHNILTGLKAAIEIKENNRDT